MYSAEKRWSSTRLFKDRFLHYYSKKMTNSHDGSVRSQARILLRFDPEKCLCYIFSGICLCDSTLSVELGHSGSAADGTMCY